jgi:hypothetical protein
VRKLPLPAGRAVFLCHQNDGPLCAGWAGTHDMDENLAIRLDRNVDVTACRDYATTVPLFSSGAEAAAHGMRDFENPGPEASGMTDKILQARKARGNPAKRGDHESRTKKEQS